MPDFTIGKRDLAERHFDFPRLATMSERIYNIILLSIAGAISRLIYVLLTRNSKTNESVTGRKLDIKISSFAASLTFLVICVAGKSSDINGYFLSKFIPDYVIKERFATNMNALMRLPPLKRKFRELKTTSEVRRYVYELAEKGMKRLDYVDLEKWNRIRAQLASVSPKVCTGFWNGKLTEDDLIAAFSRLGEDVAGQWFAITNAAVAAEFDEQRYAAASAEDFSKGLQLIASHLEKDKEKMTRILDLGGNANDEDSCWIMRVLINEGEKLDKGIKEKYLRYLATK
ncbi:MAG: hypothetical protein HYV97_02740 [Bdellovibrio sp.]|nr:hypothetical protein [Bdellovibrio sp.]